MRMTIKRLMVAGMLLAIIATGYYLYHTHHEEHVPDDDAAFRVAQHALVQDMEQHIQDVKKRLDAADRNQFQQNIPLHRLPVDSQQNQQNIPLHRLPVDRQQNQQNIPLHRLPVDRQQNQQNIPLHRLPVNRQQNQQIFPLHRLPVDRYQSQQIYQFARLSDDRQQHKQNIHFPQGQAEGISTEEKPHKDGFKLFPRGIGMRRHRNRNRREIRDGGNANNGPDLTLLKKYLDQRLKLVGKESSMLSANAGTSRENVEKDEDGRRKLTEKKQAEQMEQQTQMLQQLLAQHQIQVQSSQQSAEQADLRSQQTLMQNLLAQQHNPVPYNQQKAYQQQQKPNQNHLQQQRQQQGSFLASQQTGTQQLLQNLLAQVQNPSQYQQQSSYQADQDYAQQHTATIQNLKGGVKSIQNVEGDINVHFKGTLFMGDDDQVHLSINEIQLKDEPQQRDLLIRPQTVEQGDSVIETLQLAQQIGLLPKDGTTLQKVPMQDKNSKNASDPSPELLNNGTFADQLDDELEKIIGEDSLLGNKLEEIKTHFTKNIEQGLEPEVRLEVKTNSPKATNNPESISTTADVQTQANITKDDNDLTKTAGDEKGRTQTAGDEKGQTQTEGDEKGRTDGSGAESKAETLTKPDDSSSLNVSLYDFSQSLSGAFQCRVMPGVKFLKCIDTETHPDTSKPMWQRGMAQLLQFQSILDADTSLGALVVSADAAEFTVVAAKKNRQVVAIETDKEKIPAFHKALLVNSVNTSLVTLITGGLGDKTMTLNDALPFMTFDNVVVKVDADPTLVRKGALNLFETVNVKYLLMPWQPSSDNKGHMTLTLEYFLRQCDLVPVNNVQSKTVYTDLSHDLDFVVWTRM